MSVSRRALLLAAVAAAPPLAVTAGEAERIACPLAAAPAILVPGVSDHANTRLIGSKIYGGLLRFDAAGPQPELATAWEVSEDGLTYTFHLRRGVTWHDSGGFGAGDVVFSLDRFHKALQPRLALAGLRAVRAVDDDTVEITLREPFPPLLRLLDALVTPIVPRHVHDVPGHATDPRLVTPVGTGPFRVVAWLQLARFDWFWGAKPTLTAIDCPIMPDPAQRLAALGRGGTLLAADNLPLAAVAQLRLDPAVAIAGDVPATAALMAGLRMNQSVKPLDDKRVRRALAHATDRAALLRDGWANLGRVATGPTVAGSQDRSPAAGLPAFDPRAASAQLTAAGLRPDDDGIRLRLKYLQPAGRPWDVVGAVLRSSWGRIGIELAAEPVEDAVFARRIAAGDYEVAGFVAEQTGDPLIDLARYAAEASEVASLLNPTWDPATRAAAIAKAQDLLADEMVCLWLVEPAIPLACDVRISLPDGLYGPFIGARPTRPGLSGH